MTADESGLRSIPLHAYVGLEIEQLQPTAILTMPLGDAVRGHAPIHGGAMALMADVTCAVAIAQELDQDRERPVTTDLHMRYYAQPKASPIRAEGTVVHKGKRIISAECVIRDGDGRQLARATGSYMVIRIADD